MIFPWRSSALRRSSPSTEARHQEPHARAERHPGLPIMAADALLKPRSKAVAEIQELCSFPQEHFSALVMPLLRSVAEWCQAFPASEAHHHARPFGLLDHTLEVAILALRLRRGILLPEGATAEILAEFQDRWTYGVLAAALIHDLGKPAIDQTVTLYARGRATGETWNPWAGPVTQAQADAYLASYRKERRHRLHDRAKPMFSPWWVPPRSVQWMAADMNLLAEWIAVLHGEAGGSLVAIVAQADSASVARDLQGTVTASPVERPPEAAPVSGPLQRNTPRPLHERLLMALRHLIQEGELPLNRNGAAGWMTGGGLWMVSKRTADALRQHLAGLGVGGIPTSNDRIFDVLQEHGILIPCGDRAIWKAAVSNGEWRHTLTLLRFSLSAVWPDPGQRPEGFAGSVEWEGDASAAHEQAQQPAVDEAPIPAEQLEPSISGLDASLLQPLLEEPVDLRETQEQDANAASQASQIRQPASGERASAEHLFLQWLRAGATTGKLEINTKNARIHRIPEGLILVSPAAFQDFVAQSEAPLEWKNVQTRVRKLALHRKTGSGENFHTFLAEGQRKSGMLKGMLFPDPGAVLPDGDKLACNPHIKLVSG
jgi:integrating conjugative element relaxase (TIGR03760 family)